MILFIYEGKKFDDDGTIIEEGEFRDGVLNGSGQKKGIIYRLLFWLIFSFIEFFNLFLKARGLMMKET